MTRHGFAKSLGRLPALAVAAMLAGTVPVLAADRTITVSGDSTPSDCGAAKSANAGSMLTGSLEGCLAIFVQHLNCRAMNGFDFSTELGREEFEGKLEGADVKFDTQYVFNAVWPSGSCPEPAVDKEIAGACVHLVSGEGITGVVRFYDVIPTVGKGATNFFYEGVLTVTDKPAAAIDPLVPSAVELAEATGAMPLTLAPLPPSSC